ncbi:MAG TPA: hypothetical protein VLD37_03380 [Candidatus Bilamarchaeum sp.]|nr:hypothetical protein [Candidatus Bilamarchaeum sp.]
MSRLGVEGLRHVMDILSPHLKAATSTLASFFPDSDGEPGPEERLAEYLRWRKWRKELGYSGEAIEEEILEMMGDEYEGSAVGGDAYHAGGRFGGGGDCRDAGHGLGKGNEQRDKGADREDKFHGRGSDKIR